MAGIRWAQLLAVPSVSSDASKPEHYNLLKSVPILYIIHGLNVLLLVLLSLQSSTPLSLHNSR
jgi:hypothetical protein